MYNTLEPEPDHVLLRRKLKGSFAPTYLTALSVIQGVALADLGSVVLAGYRQFTIVHWLLAVLNFLMLIVIWNAYTVQSSIWDWIPDFRDAVIPFVFGALELLVNHMIILSLGGWLISVALLSGMGMLASWYGGWRAKEEAENTRLLAVQDTRLLRFFLLYALGLTVTLLLFGVVSLVTSLEATESLQTGRGVLTLAFVLLAGVGVGTYLFLSIRSWTRIVTYARTGHVPDMEVTPPNDEVRSSA